MADKISAERRSQNMSRVRSKDTGPEKAVRRMVHTMGYRYRLHRRNLPGRPDLVFPGRKKVIFVHGCFWHKHEDPACSKSGLPKSNRDFWLPKLKRNAERDSEQQARLISLGRDVLVVWECEIEKDQGLAERLRKFLD